MRQIGTLPASIDPRTFGDFLLAQGVTSRAMKSPDGWAIWIHNEDHVARAREELAAYQQNPNDPRFKSAASLAAEVKKKNERLDRQYRKNYREVASTWQGVRFRRRPLTIIMMVVCTVIYVIGKQVTGADDWIWGHLGFFSDQVMQNRREVGHGLDDLRRGEVWRLFTPALLHVNLIHLVFNMWAAYVLGTVIEYRRGTKVLLILILVSAVISNLGQYLYNVNIDHQLIRWGGFSGVVYALFGYVWMKGNYEPEQGMILHPNSIRTMLLWLLLGFTGFLPMANGAHLVGLMAGVCFGIARF